MMADPAYSIKACKVCFEDKPLDEFYFLPKKGAREKGWRSGTCRTCRYKQTRLWQVTDKARVNRRERNRRIRSTPRGLLDERIGGAMRAALKTSKAGRNWESLVDYTLADLYSHIERQFTKGMSWENMRDWDIDHILPCSMFSYETPDDPQFKACWALTNLRPLWRCHNLSKGGRRQHLI